MGIGVYANEHMRLWWLLFRTRDAMDRGRRRELWKQVRISPREAAAIVCIQALDKKATPSEISRWLFRERNSISELLQRMEKRGLVTKSKDLQVKNVIRVELTEKGEQIYRYVAKGITIHSIMSSLSTEDCNQLARLLTKLRSKAWEELNISKPPPYP